MDGRFDGLMVDGLPAAASSPPSLSWWVGPRSRRKHPQPWPAAYSSLTADCGALRSPQPTPPPSIAPPPNSPPLHSSRHNAEVSLFRRAPGRPGRPWQGRAEAADPRYRHYKNREADNPHSRRRKVRIRSPPPLEREANPGGRSSVGGESRRAGPIAGGGTQLRAIRTHRDRLWSDWTAGTIHRQPTRYGIDSSI